MYLVIDKSIFFNVKNLMIEIQIVLVNNFQNMTE